MIYEGINRVGIEASINGYRSGNQLHRTKLLEIFCI